MNGKGDGNLHGRRQCDSREMEIRWMLAFKNTERNRLTPEEVKALEEELACITKR